ncbi:MAG TPA: hypothetical protein VG815_05895 [Chloroflexota bacterium]|nr:hypothetical protein [Chloroflexota bacterium]
MKIDKLIIAGAGALATSVGAWLIALQLPFFIWLASIFVGLAVGEVASRLAQRRNNRTLEIVVGGAIMIGFLVIRAFQSVEPGFGYQPAQTGFAAVGVALNNPYALILLALAVIAGVTRLRQ